MAASGAKGTVTFAEVESWLSRPRLAKYMAPADGDLELALGLYVWNSRVAAAALADTGHLEVGLRNAYDSAVAGAHPDWGIDSTSLLFDRLQGHPNAKRKQTELNSGSRNAIALAKRGLGQPTHGQVVAALSFGFWVRFTDKDRESTFWTPYLHSIFPPGTRRGEVHTRVDRVSRFRNRLAHNEPVFSTRTGLHDRMKDVHDLMSQIAPGAATFVARASNVDRLLSTCPVPGLV